VLCPIPDDEQPMSAELTAKFEALKKRKRSGDTNDDEGRALAEETARLANQEVSRMQKSVAELEALLMEKEGALYDEDDDDDADDAESDDKEENNPIYFPSLPKVVVVTGEANDAAESTHDEDSEEESLASGPEEGEEAF